VKYVVRYYEESTAVRHPGSECSLMSIVQTGSELQCTVGLVYTCTGWLKIKYPTRLYAISVVVWLYN